MTTDLKGLIERARARRKWDSARGMERADTPIPYLEEELSTALESILSRQPFEHEGEMLVVVPAPSEKSIDEAVTRLYRCFKGWSKQGFGPDDVTWCVVRAEVQAMLTASAEEAKK